MSEIKDLNNKVEKIKKAISEIDPNESDVMILLTLNQETGHTFVYELNTKPENYHLIIQKLVQFTEKLKEAKKNYDNANWSL